MKSLHVKHVMAEGVLLDEHLGEKKLPCIAVLFFREANIKYWLCHANKQSVNNCVLIPEHNIRF